MPEPLQSQFSIALGGESAPAEFMRSLEHVTVETSLHLPDVATLVLHDPNLLWIDHAAVMPGVAVRVVAQAGRNEATIFDGEIVEIEPEFAATQRLTVRAFDRLHRLARGTHVRSFVNVTDGDVIEQLAREVGLQAQIGPTRQVYPYLLQANETNLAFLQRRAALLGYLLYVEHSTLFCVAPEPQRAPLQLAWGDTLYEFRPRMTTIGQVGRVVARGWDPQLKQPLFSEAGASRIVPKTQQSAQTGGDLADQVFQIQTELLVADRPIRTQNSADWLAQAAAERRAGEYIQAEGVCAGIPGLVAGVPLAVRAAGERFSGTYFVTSAVHRSSASEGYRTSFTISGLSPATLLGLLMPEAETRPDQGLVIGKVTDNNDPEQQGRVKVLFPWFSPEHTSDWARVVSVGAGKNRGVAWVPEIDDEVLVGFEMGDMHYPYVLGGLWNGIDGAPHAAQLVRNGAVQQHIIRSRDGHEIVLRDDAKGGITIADKAGNTIELDSDGKTITISTGGDLKLNAGNITLTAQGNIQLDATAQVAVSGQGVAIDGGAATVDVTATMINLN